RDISPVTDQEMVFAENVTRYAEIGSASLPKSVRIVLNGGLGTSMGLLGPKSLLEVKNGYSFLEIILAQAAIDRIELCFMNSFNTHQETSAQLFRLQVSPQPRTFLQHKFPKIVQKTMLPAQCPDAGHLEWNPPGHGDVYISLHASGLLKTLLDQGFRYAFISNSDNLGASMDMAILGYFAQNDYPFLMEVAQRTPSDAKGGHLARHRSGRLLLRESAQCPESENSAFQDIDRYRYFNTNNIWVNLSTLRDLIQKEHILRLPMILNPKPLNPRDESTTPVFQIETAMGAAISLFEGASALCVPRNRFFPVKTCNDLLILRSDRFRLGKDKRLTVGPNIDTQKIRVRLDSKFYKKIDQLDHRFPHGPPSLTACESLTVKGDVHFEAEVTIQGQVTITNSKTESVVIPKGSVISENLTF
ncbi:MAG: UTP--glucose-1-phosphate uridylyltransferase, partial [Deltaproteobacteria bacterium]|nr:UTP--glucose-1-phosphate uridylyltransferase [Deltaproteobacteria bacterium]